MPGQAGADSAAPSTRGLGPPARRLKKTPLNSAGSLPALRRRNFPAGTTTALPAATSWLAQPWAWSTPRAPLVTARTVSPALVRQPVLPPEAIEYDDDTLSAAGMVSVALAACSARPCSV